MYISFLLLLLYNQTMRQSLSKQLSVKLRFFVDLRMQATMGQAQSIKNRNSNDVPDMIACHWKLIKCMGYIISGSAIAIHACMLVVTMLTYI